MELMLKQSFTAENFRRIFDFENRKGVNLEEVFSPEVFKITEAIQSCKRKYQDLKKVKSTLTEEDYEKQLTKIRDEKFELKERREKLLTEELDKLSAQITKKGFQIKLKKVRDLSGKTVFALENNASSYFAIKQVQFNIQRFYKVKQANRYNIVRQLLNVLNNDFPKYLIRTDINSFYESIPSDKLLAKINNDQLLTQVSKKIIKNVLSEYKRLSGNHIGLPRGVGVSAYLSELHMRAYDEAIKKIKEVVYYARYVDDIVVVFSEKEGMDISTYWDILKNRLEEGGLEFNDGEKGRKFKTKKIDLIVPGNSKIIYLGYKIQFGQKKCKPKVEFSEEKVNRYKKRIDLAFKEYERRRKTNKKAAHKIMLKRALFLTGNTRLLNSKSHAMVGIFYSNNLVTERKALNILDKSFKIYVNKLEEGSLKARLKKMSFKQGFEQKTFSNFTTKDLSEIVKVWQDET
jgi:hypothetical protein